MRRARTRPLRALPQLEILEDRVVPATFTVSSTADSGLGSLRQAIMDANAMAGADTIRFEIPTSDANFVDVDSFLAGGDTAADAFVIQPLTDLPLLTDSTGGTTIDGASQTAFTGDTNPFGPEIVLDGSLSSGGLNICIFVRSNDIHIIALNIQHFSIGISLEGDSGSVTGCYVGTDATGTVDEGNSASGIDIVGANNTVGGTSAADRNIVSGNDLGGFSIFNGASGNLVIGNFIGVDRTGTAALGNSFEGVYIESPDNTIGGLGAGEGNVISGNGLHGVGLNGPNANDNSILGNYIGVSADGISVLGNAGVGIGILGGGGNTIAGNRIVGNGKDGVGIVAAADTIIGEPGHGNLISGNTWNGLVITAGATGTVVQGNYIGTDLAGTADLGNTFNGIVIDNSPSNTIGGTTAGERNVVSGNDAWGIMVLGSGSTGNLIEGNYIGTDVSGTSAVANSVTGIWVRDDASFNTIGGTVDGAGNLVSGNLGHGVQLDLGANNNVVQGNLIGTDVTGMNALGNQVAGVGISADADNNVIGGDNEAARNIIAGNALFGVLIVDRASNNQVQGTYIGTAADGTTVLGNGLFGVALFDPGTADNKITGNRVAGNVLDGIVISSGADNNVIGGTAAGEGNLIWDSGLNGIDVFADAIGNTLQGNAIWNSGVLGIDLAEDPFFGAGLVALNDAYDPDSGPNNYQNFPFITHVSQSDGDTNITGVLYSMPSTSFRLEFFANDSLNASGFREGQYVLGYLEVATDATGKADFTFTYSGSLPGPVVTATATDLTTGDTSEFFNPSPPTDISLDNQSLPENSGASAFVGTFTTTDADLGDAFIYTLVSGDGDADNAAFTIIGDKLYANDGFDFETQSSYMIRVRTTDLWGFYHEKSFTITVTDVDEQLDLSGRVFLDHDNDGLFNAGDTGLAGVVVRLFNENDLINPVATETTDDDGLYHFVVAANAGSYRLVASQPSDLLDGKETAGTLGGTVDNSQDSDGISGIGHAGNSVGTGYNFADIRPSRVQGLVWEDFNNDGEVNFGEQAIEGAVIHLVGTDDRGQAVDRVVTTDAQGIFEFTGLRPSNASGYSLLEEQPSGFVDGQESLGTVNGVLSGTAADNYFSAIGMQLPGSDAVNYNFGERPAAGGTVHTGQTASIGFWQNRNGQDLIRSLNGGPTATQLGYWLAATFPNLYGPSAGASNLAGKTNAQVAAFFTTLYKRTSSVNGPAKVDAQVLGVALAVYVTNENLAGTTASAYGFQVTADGVGTATFDVGDANRAAFGLSVTDSTVMTVLDILLATNSQTVNGLLYDADGSGTIISWEKALRSMANKVYTAINELGHV